MEEKIKKEEKKPEKDKMEEKINGDSKKDVSKENEAPEKEISKIKKKAKVVVKEKAIANGFSLRISLKHSVAICKVLIGKNPDDAIKRLEDVVSKKRSIPMSKLEVAHQKGKGISGAKYPKNACLSIIEIIKQVKANAVVNGIENPVISIAKSNKASAPFRKGGRKAKRTHIYLEVADKTKLKDKIKKSE